MNRFLITMNMPTRSGSPIHQVICEHPAKTVSDFILSIGEEEFFTVEEFYRDNAGNYFSAGMVALNVAHIGKIKMDKEK
jgi:hypothetical protein